MCPSNSPFVEVFAPFDRARIGAAATAEADSVERALKTAFGLFRNRDAWLPLAERIRILEKAQELMRPRAETLAVEAAREGGKPLVDSRVEIARAIDSLRICVETLRTDAGEVIPMNVGPPAPAAWPSPSSSPSVLLSPFSAFNHPVNLITHQIGPAIAAGCPVIIKPAKTTPLSCFRKETVEIET